MEDKISVIMSVYKENEKELKDAIDSILNQTYSNFEFIIVIDNPDEKWRIDFIKGYNDSRIKLIVNKDNIGLPKSLNVALEHSTGKYIARMDADDIALPFRFEKQLKYIKETGYDMCGGNIVCFYDDIDFKKIYYPTKNKDINTLVYMKNCVPHPTYFVKKEVYDFLNGYNNIFSAEDYDFLFRVVKNNFKVGNVSDVILRYRINPQSISRKNAGKQELIAQYLKRKYKKKNIFEVSEKDLNYYLTTKSFKRKLASYDNYLNLKNERVKYKEKKGLKYYMYTFLIIINIKHSLRELYVKFYEKIICDKEVL